MELLQKRLLRTSVLIAVFGVIALGFYSCKKDAILKDELTDENSALVGDWEWDHTDHYYGWCLGESWEETLNPITELMTYSLSFNPSGIVSIYKDNIMIEQHRLVFDYSNIDQSQEGTFSVKLDGYDDKRMSGSLSEDTLLLVRHPFLPEPSCENYQNIFFRN